MIEIATLFGTIKQATDLAKLIKDSGSTLERAEHKMKLAELLSALADAKMQAAEVQDVLLEKDNAIRELRARLDVKGLLRYRPPHYWLEEQGAAKQGPYCQCCQDRDGKLSRLIDRRDGDWYCTVCNSCYYGGQRQQDTRAIEPDF